MTYRMMVVNVIVFSALWGTANAQDAQAPPSRSDGHAREVPSSSSDEKQDQQRKDRDAIRRSSDEFVRAFNAGNAKAVASLWAEDGDYRDDEGRTLNGRAAIEGEYAQFFRQHPGTKMRIVIDSIRLLNDDAAIEDGRAMLEPPPAGAPATGQYTAVHVKTNGKWLMSTVRDSRVETPSAFRNIADLEWLIGTWSAEEHGAKVQSSCRWVANKSFLARTYSVTRADQERSSGIQIIGWNPQSGRIQSWNFTSDGGHAVGLWTPIENGWAIETTGMLPDGTSTSATNLMARLDDNAYAWRSVERMASSLTLPDTDEVVLKRQTAGQK